MSKLTARSLVRHQEAAYKTQDATQSKTGFHFKSCWIGHFYEVTDINVDFRWQDETCVPHRYNVPGNAAVPAAHVAQSEARKYRTTRDA